MSKDYSVIKSDKEKAGHYVAEMLDVSVKTEENGGKKLSGIEFLLRIGGEIYRIDFHKCTTEQILPDSTHLLRDMTDSQHERLHDVQNLINEMANGIVHILEEIQMAQ